MKMKKTTKLLLKICKIIFIGVLLFAILLNMISIFKRLLLKEQMPLVLGYGNAVIITGSMEPEILPGDMVIVHSQNDYAIDDIVTYQGNNNPITHRIIAKTPEGYITQGDANNIPDEKVLKQQMLGKVIFVLPKVGGITDSVLSPFGIFLLGCIGLLAWLIQRIRGKENE